MVQILAIFGQNGPKSMFFAHISKVTHQIFLIFCLKPCLYECKKFIVSFFGRKFKIGPFLVQNGLFWTIFDQKWGKRDTSCKNAPIRLKFGQKLHFSGVYPFIFLLSSIPQNWAFFFCSPFFYCYLIVLSITVKNDCNYCWNFNSR